MHVHQAAVASTDRAVELAIVELDADRAAVAAAASNDLMR
jgi:hypothetical protein